MAHRSPVIQWLCLSVLLCFLSSAISSAAKEALPAAAQNSTESQLQPGEAVSIANLAISDIKQAIETNNETVKRIETFYSTTVQLFLGTITVLAVLTGIVGSIAIGRIAKSTAKAQTQESLEPYMTKYDESHAEFLEKTNQVILKYNEIINEHEKINKGLEEEQKGYEKLCKEFDTFQKNAITNLHGLRSAMLGWHLVIQFMQDPDRLKSMLEDARPYIDDVVNQLKPLDPLIASLAFGVQGVILYYDKDFKGAVDALRKSISANRDNFAAHFNLACCACKLADEIEAKELAEKTAIWDLEGEALSSLSYAVKTTPWRKAAARRESESEKGDLKRLRQSPHFQSLISE